MISQWLMKLLAELGSLSLPAYSQERVVAAYGGISGQQAPLWVASDLGLFKKYGLDLEPVFIAGGATRTAAISAGVGTRGFFRAFDKK